MEKTGKYSNEQKDSMLLQLDAKHKFVIMKAEKISKEKKLPKGFVIDPTLNGKYKDEPVFKVKAEKINQILRKAGVPKF